ncbi:MAG: hypothetical protein QOE90_3623 [Thermoplasmata archaeon]|nr:hypothetical protein [Thermoplasmata archaeon]
MATGGIRLTRPVLALALLLALAGGAQAASVHLTSPRAALALGPVTVEAPRAIVHDVGHALLDEIRLRDVTGTVTISTATPYVVDNGAGIPLVGGKPQNTTLTLRHADLNVSIEGVESRWMLDGSAGGTARVLGLDPGAYKPSRLAANFSWPVAGDAPPLPSQEAYSAPFRWPAGWAFLGDVTGAGTSQPTGAGATVSPEGAFTFYLKGGIADFRDATGQETNVTTGRTFDTPLHTGQANDVSLTFVGTIGSGVLHLQASAGLAAPQMTWRADDVLWQDATGEAEGAAGAQAFQGQEVRVQGALAILPQSGETALSRDGYDITGRIDDVTIGGESVRLEPAAGSAAVPVAAATVGLVGLALVALRVAVLLYTRLSPEEVGRHPQRRVLLDAVRAEPGIHLRELQRRLGSAWGPFTFHLRMLEDAGYLRQERQGRYRLVFPRGAVPLGASATIPLGLARELYDSLPEDGAGVDARELAARLGVSRQLLNHHLRALQARGLVRDEGRGAARRVARVTPAAG